jgi:hypothetical protein
VGRKEGEERERDREREKGKKDIAGKIVSMERTQKQNKTTQQV